MHELANYARTVKKQQLDAYLLSLGACAAEREAVVQWANGRNLQECWDACERLDWLQWLVRAPALAEYERVTAPALAEDDRVTATAWAEYERVTATALACCSCDELRAKFNCPKEVCTWR